MVIDSTGQPIWPDEAIPPGVTLAETIEALGMPQAELARRAGRPIQVINEIIQGKKEITAETAIEFERVLGVPAHFWVNLEADYRMTKAKIEERAQLKAQATKASSFPYAEMARHGWVPKTRDPEQRTGALLRFFGVATFDQLQLASVQWRRSTVGSVSVHALTAWLRRGEIEAAKVQADTYDESGLKEVARTLPALSLDTSGAFHRELVSRLAAVGVALVCVKHLAHTGAQGAARWFAGRPLVQLSDRYRWADIFWFTLFHEIGHILKHGRKEFFVDFEGPATTAQEQQADDFAAKVLIPEIPYQRFVSARSHVSLASVRAFAHAIGVHPTIVVGRLHHDRIVPPTHLHQLRLKYAITPGCD